jgi:hypothetical protein
MKFNFFFALGLISALLAACGGGTSAPASNEVRPAPDFILPNALGGEVSLNDYEDEPVFLLFHMAVG